MNTRRFPSLRSNPRLEGAALCIRRSINRLSFQYGMKIGRSMQAQKIATAFPLSKFRQEYARVLDRTGYIISALTSLDCIADITAYMLAIQVLLFIYRNIYIAVIGLVGVRTSRRVRIYGTRGIKKQGYTPLTSLREDIFAHLG